jgi:hypothetical protein
VIDSSLASFMIDVEVLEIVVEIDTPSTEITAKESSMCREDSGEINMTFST